MIALFVNHWWSICLLTGGTVLLLCGGIRLWLGRQDRKNIKEERGLATGEQKQKAVQKPERPGMPKPKEYELLPTLHPALGETLEDLSNTHGVEAWFKKNRAIITRKRAGQVIDAEIDAAKRLRIAKLHQEMERLELQDLVERKRLLKELEELERDIRVLRDQPERPPAEPAAKSFEEKQQEEIRRQKEKHEHDIALKKLKAEYELEERQSLLLTMNEKIDEIRASDQYTEAEKQELIEDIEDHYRTFLSRDA